MAEPKEGVDFEIREVKGKKGNVLYKNRHFFTAAEKAARNAPKAAPVKAKAPTPTKATKATPKPTQDAMKGYRKGDVTTAPIGGTGGRTPPKSTADIVDVAKKGIDKGSFKQPRHPTSSPRIIDGLTLANVTALGSVTREDYNKMTPEQRVAKGLPRYLGRYAIREDSFKPSVATSKPTTPAASTVAQAGKVGRYAKGGTVKKKGK